jgi:hypothetical protein
MASAGSNGSSGTSGTSGSSGTSGVNGAQGIGYAGLTSVTSNVIGTGNKTFGVSLNHTQSAFQVGERVRIFAVANTFMEGDITVYSGASLTVNVVNTSGSGTYTSWSFSVIGIVGGNGSSGTSGANGANGSSGTSGVNGANGSSGSAGSSGTSGTSGLQGAQGAPGSSGTSGLQGAQGAPGSAGTSGTSGSSGSAGSSGKSGSSGTSGVQGAQGAAGGGLSGGTSPKIPYWTGASTLGISDISQNALASGGIIVASALEVGSIASHANVPGRIDASGDVVAFSTSDRNLKENFSNISDALSKVESISGYEFDWKLEHKHHHGFEGHDIGVIAQEIESVLPEAVTTRDSGFKGVKYEKIVPLLIEAIKELSAEIKELKKK